MTLEFFRSAVFSKVLYYTPLLTVKLHITV